MEDHKILKNKILESALALIFIVISIGTFVFSRDFPPTADPIQSNAFPRLLATLLIIFCAVLIARNIIYIKSNLNVLRSSFNMPNINLFLNFKDILFTLILLILYTQFVRSLGFILTSIILMFLTMIIYGERRLKILFVYNFIFVFAIYFIFGELARVPLPTGILENLIF